MTGANHVLAGAVVGAVIHEPAVALPLAFVSHFLLDSLPHFGFSNYEERKKHKNLLETILAIDGVMLLLVIGWLLNSSANWLVLACAFTAVAPDLVWVYRYIIPEKFGKLEPSKGTWFSRFHKQIQKHEFPKGFIIEYATTIMLLIVIVKLV